MSKAKWRLGLVTWLVIGGLLLINASVLLNGDDPQATRRLLHHFNPWHWPGWYAVNLWLVFGGALVVLILRNSRIQSRLHSFYASRFWQSAKTHFIKSKPNQTVVRFVLHRKFGKWLLRKWLTFWKGIKVERYPVYAWVFALTAIFIVFFRHAAWMEMPRNYLLFYWKYPRQFIY